MSINQKPNAADSMTNTAIQRQRHCTLYTFLSKFHTSAIEKKNSSAKQEMKKTRQVKLLERKFSNEIIKGKTATRLVNERVV